MRKITNSQYEELEESCEIMGDQQFFDKLEEYTGITEKPYIAYNFYDCDDNYIGNSEEFDLDTILENAYVEVVEDGK